METRTVLTADSDIIYHLNMEFASAICKISVKKRHTSCFLKCAVKTNAVFFRMLLEFFAQFSDFLIEFGGPFVAEGGSGVGARRGEFQRFASQSGNE